MENVNFISKSAFIVLWVAFRVGSSASFAISHYRGLP